jgi:CheY-like chemotaxis protein
MHITLIDDNIPLKLQGDLGKLRQILVNLVNNAIKFTSEGEILITVDLISTSAGEIKIKFIVKDTGIGIDKSAIKKLFQSFYQVDAATNRKYGGTGLGLAICKQLIELMGGEIWVKSEVNQGSEFIFNLLFNCVETSANNQEKQPKNEPKINQLQNYLTGMRILVVDDNATNRQIICEKLQRWGLLSDAVNNAQEALNALQKGLQEKQPYHLALIDHKMPEMDGKELAKIIISHPNLCQTKIVMMTFINSQNEIKYFLEHQEFNYYLIKPIKSSRLFDMMITTLAPQVMNKLQNHQNYSENNQDNKDINIANYQIKILVAEDNFTNQKVVANQLKILGYEADFVSNGEEVLKLIKYRLDHNLPTYDIILMDCQMPLLDGYKTTEAIRQAENADQHITIIAMTANAMKGDKEKCLAAGMDDYISKPTDLDKFKLMLQRWTPIQYRELPQENVVQSIKNAPYQSQIIDKNMTIETNIIDLSRLQEISGGDAEFEQELLLSFVDDTKQELQAIKLAFTNQDLEQLKHYAHQLKGSSGNVGINSMQTTALEIEKCAKSQTLLGVDEYILKLESDLQAVEFFISNY